MRRTRVKMYKIGNFIYAYDDDGLIIHCLMKYQFVENRNSVGFPENSLSKVKASLEANKIPYEVHDKEGLVEEYKLPEGNYHNAVRKALDNYDIEYRVGKMTKKVENMNLEEVEELFKNYENKCRE